MFKRIFKYKSELTNALCMMSTLFIIGILYKIYTQFNRDKVILITQYYEPENEERKTEIRDCLINNSKNKLIDEIHLFVEKDYDFSFINLDKIKLINTDKQLSYKKSFDYSNINFDSKNIIILANSDIYFNNTLDKIHDLNFDNTFFALNKYNLQKNGEIILYESIHSQDVWIWKTPIKVIRDKNNENDFFDEEDGVILGIGGCDNRIVRIMKNTGYNVKNIGNKLQCIHNHKNDYRNWNTDPNKLNLTKKYRKNGTDGLTMS